MKSVFALMVIVLLSSSLIAKNQPLNVLMVAVDDLRPELGCYGASKVISPNFDRLAESGTRFERAYCQQSVCGASRLSIMTGLYPTQSGEQTYHVRGWRQRYPNLLTLNQHFQRSQYKTIGLGKIYHARAGADADESGWNKWINIRETMYADPANLEYKKTFSVHKPETKLGAFTEALDVSDDQYADGKRTSRAVELLSELAESEERFFLALGFVKPHLPFVAPKRYWDLYGRDEFSTPDNVGVPAGYPRYAANMSAWELKFYVDYEGDSPADFSDALNKRLLHGYAACTSYVDACLGKLLDTLDETGLAHNTIVVLWGDHGFKLGDHGSWSKHTNFEVDTRVPLLIRVPGKEGGQASESLVEMVDLYPTLCELAGIPVPQHCQGKSFAELLDSPEQPHRNSVYSTYPADEDVSEKVASGMTEGAFPDYAKIGAGHSIRFGEYRYSEWRPRPDLAASAAVLANLSEDPEETLNVVEQPQHESALEEGRRLLSERVKAAAPIPAGKFAFTTVTDKKVKPKVEAKPDDSKTKASRSEHSAMLLDFEDESVLSKNNVSHKAEVLLVKDTPNEESEFAVKTIADSEAGADGYFGTAFLLQNVDLRNAQTIQFWIKTDIESNFNLQIHSGPGGVGIIPFNTVGSKGAWKQVSARMQTLSQPSWGKAMVDLAHVSKLQVTAFGSGPYDGKYMTLDGFYWTTDVAPRDTSEEKRKTAIYKRRQARLRKPVILQRGEAVEMFDGKTLDGWLTTPRVYLPGKAEFQNIPSEQLYEAVIKHYEASEGSINRIPDKERGKDKGVWAIEDGVVIGAQTPGSISGSYLLSEKKYGDFELTLEANPDYPIDTGIMVRAHRLGSVGYQVLVDNRPNGTIGGVYGNSVGSFFAYPFVFDADELPLNRIANYRPGNPNALRFRGGQFKTDYAATLDDFLEVWKPNDWNEIRIRCTGRLPLIETWINGIPIAKIDTATLADQVPNYDAEAIFKRIGRKGHIGLEVHDSPTRDRWAPGAKCRWRNVRIRELKVAPRIARETGSIRSSNVGRRATEHALEDETKPNAISLTKIDGRHWLVDSLGKPFFAHGITHVSNNRANFDFNEISAACKKLGFNTYGYGCPEPLRHDMPFIESWNHLVPISTYRGKKTRYVDVFDPAEQAKLEKGVKASCDRARRHPENVIGYCWTDLGAWPLENSTGKNWVEFMRELPPEAPGNQAWQTHLKSWDGDDSKARDQAFLKLIAREYFRIVGGANRKHDPDRLIFGDRFAFNTLDQDVIEEMLPWVDAIAIQPQFWAPFPKKKFDEIYELTGKPILVCDFAIRFKDGDKDVRTWKLAESSVAAGEAYTEYVKAALATEYIIGTFWCNPVDTPKGFGKPGVKQGFFEDGLASRPGLHEAVKELNQYRIQVTPVHKDSATESNHD